MGLVRWVVDCWRWLGTVVSIDAVWVVLCLMGGLGIVVERCCSSGWRERATIHAWAVVLVIGYWAAGTCLINSLLLRLDVVVGGARS